MWSDLRGNLNLRGPNRRPPIQQTHKSSNTNCLPNWLIKKEKVLLKRHVKSSKYADFTDVVELRAAWNPPYPCQDKIHSWVDKTVSPMNWHLFSNPGNGNLLLSNPLFMFLPRSRPAMSSIRPHNTLTICHSQNLPYQLSVVRIWWRLASKSSTSTVPQRLVNPPDRLNYNQLGSP